MTRGNPKLREFKGTTYTANLISSDIDIPIPTQYERRKILHNCISDYISVRFWKSFFLPFSRHHRHHNFGYPSYKRPPAAMSSSPPGWKDNMYTNKCRTSGCQSIPASRAASASGKMKKRGRSKKGGGCENRNRKQTGLRQIPFVAKIIKT